MKLALCLFAVAMALPAATVEEIITANLAKFAVAAKAGDGATLNTLLAEDLIYGHSSGKFENKKECVDALVKGKQTYTNKDATIRVYGNTALVNTVMHVEPNGFNLAVLQVWVKKGKDWQMVSRHSTRLP